MTGHSDALDTLRRVYLEGLRIDLVDTGTPVVRGGAPPSPDLKANLTAHRQAIIDELTRHRIGQPDPGFNSRIRRRFVTPSACLAGKACSRLGMCSEALRRLPCDHTGQEAA